jgi:transposase
LANKEATTTRKCKFFDAYNGNKEGKSLRSITSENNISEGCGRKWLKQREIIGSLAQRSTRGRSTKLGQRSKVTKSMCKMLVDPVKNPVRKAQYEAQIQYHNLPVQQHQLRRKLKEYTNRGQKYKCAFVKKVPSGKNMDERQDYSAKHEAKPLHRFWDHIFFTDKVHIDPSSLAIDRILRERGHRYDDENIQWRGQKKGVKFHIAASINWYYKQPELEFYNDEKDHIEQPLMPPKPRRRPKSDTDAECPHPVEVKVKGNTMTQKYYIERHLPIYCEAVKNGAHRDSLQ